MKKKNKKKRKRTWTYWLRRKYIYVVHLFVVLWWAEHINSDSSSLIDLTEKKVNTKEKITSKNKNKWKIENNKQSAKINIIDMDDMSRANVLHTGWAVSEQVSIL